MDGNSGAIRFHCASVNTRYREPVDLTPPDCREPHDAYGRHALASVITLNYWAGPHCYAQPWEATLPFARQLPRALSSTVDAVLLSIYETSCDPIQRPSAEQVATILRELGSIFPRAELGIGEVGAQGIEDGKATNPSRATKEQIARRYYGMHSQLKTLVGPRFVGGYFWWYFVDDAVPRHRPDSLWPTLNELLTALS